MILQAIWLGLQAHRVVLNRRRGQYGTVVRALTRQQADFAVAARRRLQQGVEGYAQILRTCESVLDEAQWL